MGRTEISPPMEDFGFHSFFMRFLVYFSVLYSRLVLSLNYDVGLLTNSVEVRENPQLLMLVTWVIPKSETVKTNGQVVPKIHLKANQMATD